MKDLREQVYGLIKQYANDTGGLSFHKRSHEAYKQLVAIGPDAIPFLLERLQDSIGHDRRDAMDMDNNPRCVMMAIGEITHGESHIGFPHEHAGQFDKLREHVLNWGKNRQ